MILHGNQRGGAKDLAQHLMKAENERVEVHEMRGFVADTLEGAFRESYAISRATKCKQHLYSLSINPPADAEISPEQLVEATNQAEKRLGLAGQPRTIVFHEKHGANGELRRHAHAVWCRIDTDSMTAKQISFDKEKLREVSRDLHIQHDLKMPLGLINSKDRNPRNFTLAEWQQCKRTEKDPAQVKSLFQDSWAISDSKAAFARALEERGYFLAQGRRGHVAVDFKGEKYAVSRYIGIRAKEVRSRLGEADGLLSVEKAQKQAAQQVADRLQELKTQQQQEITAKREREKQQQHALRSKQAEQTIHQNEAQQQQRAEEEQTRKARVRGGLFGIWDRVTGKRKATEIQNKQEATQARKRDKRQAKELERHQQQAAETLQKQAQAERKENELTVKELKKDIQEYAPAPTKDLTDRPNTYIEQQRQRLQNRQSRPREGPTIER